MKIIVTGANGFIGKQLCHQLIQNGIEFVTLGRHQVPGIKAQHIYCDLLQSNNLPQLILPLQATHLIHLAWITEHGNYWHSPSNYDWLSASLDLVDAFSKSGGAHITIAGTCAEYDWRYGYCSESLTPLRALSCYSECKHVLLKQCQTLCNANELALTWARVFFCYGRGEHEARLIPSLSRVFSGEQAPFGVNLENYRDFIHVRDVARAFLTLAVNNARGEFNIASSQPLQLRRLVELIAFNHGVDHSTITQLSPTTVDSIRLLVGNNQRLCDLGWRPNISLEAGLADFSPQLKRAAN